MPFLRELVTGITQRKSDFDPRLVCMEIVLEKVITGKLMYKRIIKSVQLSFYYTNHICFYTTWETKDVDGRIILRWIFRKWDVGVWTGSSWHRMGTGGGHFRMR